MEKLYLNEKSIWEYLKGKGLHEYAIAGIMGNLYAESSLSPINLSNAYEKKSGYTDTTYTAAVLQGIISKEEFATDHAAYGLAQWASSARKRNLYDFTKGQINHMNLQLDFLLSEIKNYKNLSAIVSNPSSIKEVSDEFLIKFENPANKSEAVKNKRYNYALSIYERNAGARYPYTVEVICSSLNVRKGPSLLSSLVTRLPRGTKVMVYDENGVWGKIGEGKWIHLEKYTKKVG